MIPYDDLVVALQTWRAQKGLPVAQLSGALTPPPVMAPPPPRAAPPRAAAAPAAAPPRPAAPPAPAAKARPPAPAAAPPPPRGQRQAITPLDEPLDDGALLDDAALQEHLGAGDNGGNFSLQFDPNATLHEEEIDESTAVGVVPASRNNDMDATNPHGNPTLPRTAPNRNDDW